MTILTGSMTLVTLLGLPETYVPQLLHSKAVKLRQELGDMRYHSKHSAAKSDAAKTLRVCRVIRSSETYDADIILLDHAHAALVALPV